MKTTVKNTVKSIKYKKIGVLLLALMFLAIFLGCSNQAAATKPSADQPKTTVKVATLKGPTGMAMVQMMENQAQGKAKNNYEFSLLGAPDEAVAMITSGEADIVGVPTNLAATLYEKTQGNVKLININTLGVLYVLERGGNSIETLADLKGKTVYSTGQGSTPEYVFNYILSKNGLDPTKDLQVEYKAEHSELASLLAAGKVDIAVLPQPFVTSVLAKNPDIRVALDLTAQWDKVAGADKPLAMGAAIVRSDFLANHEGAVRIFLEELKASTEFTNRNLEEAAALVEKYDIMPEAVAKAAIPKCNMVYLSGKPMQDAVNSFLDIMYQANPKSVGGKMPDDDFYYTK